MQDNNNGDFKKEKLRMLVDRTSRIFATKEKIWCPYFHSHVYLNSEGLHHLQNKPNRLPRSVEEQLLKFGLVSWALQVISRSGTLQELRERMEKFGRSGKDGFYKTKWARYWGFHAIVRGNRPVKIVVVIKRTGDGQLIFWSVLPYKKIKNQRLYSEGFEED